MKILLTGANGYIGTRLISVLLQSGYEVVCLVRDVRRLNEEYANNKLITVIEADLLDQESFSSSHFYPQEYLLIGCILLPQIVFL